jgi:hypothetical protein
MKSFISKPSVIFIFLFVVISIFYNYPKILSLNPRSLHAWRQSDCTSITLNYYQHGMKFFEPEIHNLISDNNTSGRTVGEFPILYYLVALIWKFTGVHIWIYRSLQYIIMFMGLFSLFKIAQTFLSDIFWSLFIPLLLFASPIFADYGISFLTNATSLSLVFIALRQLQKYYTLKKVKFLVISFVIFTLAALMKTSSLIGFFFMMVIMVGERIRFFNPSKTMIFNHKVVLVLILLLFSAILGWYFFAESSNAIHKGKYTFNDLWPIWRMKKPEIISFLNTIRTTTIYLVFHILIIILLAIGFLYMLVMPSKSKPFFYYGNIILFLGSVTYFLFWFNAMNYHDYYYIDLLLFLIFIPLSVLMRLKENYTTLYKSLALKIFMAILLIFNLYYTKEVLELRYFAKSEKKYSVIPSNDLVGLLRWISDNRKVNIEALEEIQPYLKQIGIKPEDQVISIPDQSFNITLFLLNHRGWTEYGHDKEHLFSFAKGAKYLIINDTTLKQEEYLKPHLTQKIGSFKNVEIFKVPN